VKTFLAIDFGTTQTYVAKIVEGEKKGPSIMDIDGENKISTALRLDSWKNVIFFGNEAIEKIEEDPQNTFLNFKPYVGTDKIFQGSDVSCTADELSLIFLTHLREKLETDKFGKVTFADKEDYYWVIGCPADWSDDRKKKIAQIAAEAGFGKHVSCCDEPLGAIYYYRYNENLPLTETKTILVYDFGGGTTDLAIEEICLSENSPGDNNSRLTAVAGISDLGGKNFDERLANHFAEEMTASADKVQNKDFDRHYRILQNHLREIKERLSNEIKNGRYSYSKKLPRLFSKKTETDLELTKEDFEKICGYLMGRFDEPIKDVLQKAGITRDEINYVIIAGGSSRFYYVKDKLKEEFDENKIFTSSNQVEIIAQGLAFYARDSVCSAKPESMPGQNVTDGETASHENPIVPDEKNSPAWKKNGKKIIIAITPIIALALGLTWFFNTMKSEKISETNGALEQPADIGREFLTRDEIVRTCQKYGFSDGGTF
jgi:molecular chaperone DnaK (HSP70)